MLVNVSVVKSITGKREYHLVFDGIYYIRINKKTFEKILEALELYKKIK